MMKNVIFSLFAMLLSVSYLLAQNKATFTLRNNTEKSIKLKIPKVMNPNLSPNSDSGVSLEYGQKIFFFNKGKKQLLLVVNERFDGKVVMVEKLINQKKLEE